MANLSVLVHPNTTNPRRDHEADPVWIGPALAVHADKLPEHAEMEEEPAPNTNPVMRPERGPCPGESRPSLP